LEFSLRFGAGENSADPVQKNGICTELSLADAVFRFARK